MQLSRHDIAVAKIHIDASWQMEKIRIRLVLCRILRYGHRYSRSGVRRQLIRDNSQLATFLPIASHYYTSFKSSRLPLFTGAKCVRVSTEPNDVRTRKMLQAIFQWYQEFGGNPRILSIQVGIDALAKNNRFIGIPCM
jgi:hypothetical protein